MISRYLRFVKKLYILNVSTIKQAIRSKNINSRENINYTTLPKIVHEEARCCFVLSTGRCGTKLLTNLLGLSSKVRCEHTPSPELIHFSKIAYEKGFKAKEEFQLGIAMARYELIRNTFLKNQPYVETNNRITFFAPFLAEVFKKSKFIHLVRHPANFVGSGIRRNWYSGKNSHDAGRIVSYGTLNWKKMTEIEKIAWLWNETNQFIEDFKANIEDVNRVMFVKAEDLFSKTEASLRIFEFLEVEPPLEKKISKVIKNPINVQKEGKFPEYNKWNPDQKAQLRRYARLSSKYGYNLD